MKGFRSRFILFLTLVLVLSLTVACSTNQSSPREHVANESSDMAPKEEMDYEESEGSPLEPEKVITTIYMDLETTEFDKASQSLKTKIEKHDAYVESSNISYTRSGKGKRYKNAHYVIRVPKDKVSDFTTSLDHVGNIVSESTYKEDVTRQYRDTESRLKIIETKEKRILELLDKAKQIEDIIKLENELNETIYEKEQLQTNLIHIDDKVDFSTFEIHIKEVDRLSSGETIDTKFGTKIKNAFSNSIYTFKIVMEKLVLLAIYILPFGVIIGIIYYIARRFIKDKTPPKE